MAYEVNEKIRELVPYQPITGNYRIRLDANESFLVPENEILKAIQKDAVSVAFQRYPDPIAQELCEAFAKAYNVNVENVVAGNGSDELISLLFSSFLMKGECAVTLSPDFSMYSFYCGIAEGQNKEFKKRDDFSFSIDDLIDFVNKNKARMLIFSNPCNPTSLGVKREEIRKLVSSVNALVVLDEAYMDFWDQSMLSEVNQYDNLIILRTCSKAIGAASLRLGFAVSNVKSDSVHKSS
jgi:histidinol-phosphate aminotransferase